MEKMFQTTNQQEIVTKMQLERPAPEN